MSFSLSEFISLRAAFAALKMYSGNTFQVLAWTVKLDLQSNVNPFSLYE